MCPFRSPARGITLQSARGAFKSVLPKIMIAFTHTVRVSALTALVLAGSVFCTQAQEVSIPDPGLNAAVRAALQKPVGPLTEQDLLNLRVLNAAARGVTRIDGLEGASNLISLGLDSNALTNFVMPGSFTNLQTLVLFNNHLTNFALPRGFEKLALLDLGFNSISQCSLTNGLTNLATLFLEGNLLSNFNLPTGLGQLTEMDLSGNFLSSLSFPADMTNLITVLAFANRLTNVVFASQLSRLTGLDLDFNLLSSLTIPAGMIKLNTLSVHANLLTNLSLAGDLGNLGSLDVDGNLLASLVLPTGMTNLEFLRLGGNQLTRITVPPDATNLSSLILDGNPLTALVLSEPLAAGNLADTVAALNAQKISVFTYPLTVQMVAPRLTPDGKFVFAVTGPPGIYALQASFDLASWLELAVVTNQIGFVRFLDPQAELSGQKFYRARSLP